MGRQYRKEAKAVIERVITEATCAGIYNQEELIKRIRAAYPFGQMYDHTYTVYVNEMNRQLKRLKRGHF